MGEIEIHQKKGFTTMLNTHLQDKNISLKACGLMSRMLSLPQDWDYSINGLAQICKEGVKSIRSALKELEEAGYLVRTQIRDENGHFYYKYDLYEDPSDILPHTPKGHAVKRHAEKDTQKNTNNKINNKKDSKKESQGESDTYNDIIESEIDDPKVHQALIEFIKMRKLIKKPITNYGLIDLINRLQQLSGNNPEIMLNMLNNSIRNSWPDIYLPLSDREPEQKTKQGFTNYSQREVDMSELEKVMFKT